MSDFNRAIEGFDNKVKNMLSFLDNQYVSSMLSIFLIVYAAYAAPKLPAYILKLFDEPLFKLVLFFLIAYTAKKNPTVAIIAAIGLLVTIHALNKVKLDTIVSDLVCKQEEHMRNIQGAQLQGGQQQDSHMRDMLEIQQNDLAGDMVFEDDQDEMASLHSEGVVEIQNQMKPEPSMQANESIGQQMGGECTRTSKYRNSFYPNYVNADPSVYNAKFQGDEIHGFDDNARYASI